MNMMDASILGCKYFNEVLCYMTDHSLGISLLYLITIAIIGFLIFLRIIK